MALSIFTSIEKTQNEQALNTVLGECYTYWKELCSYTNEKYPGAVEEWHSSGKKYGYTFRIKDKKRAIVYLIPQEGFFYVGIVFGQKATDKAFTLPLLDYVRSTIEEARVYAEGRGFRLEVQTKEMTEQVKMLIDVKLSF